MADTNGTALAVGDTVTIVRMDDPTYARLVGMQGTIAEIPPPDHGQSHDTQLLILLDDEQVGAISTQQAWVEKVD